MGPPLQGDGGCRKERERERTNVLDSPLLRRGEIVVYFVPKGRNTCVCLERGRERERERERREGGEVEIGNNTPCVYNGTHTRNNKALVYYE